MATEVFIPKMTDFMEEGAIVAWLVGEGEPVAEGQAVSPARRCCAWTGSRPLTARPTTEMSS
jgi:hypothetical protein